MTSNINNTSISLEDDDVQNITNVLSREERRKRFGIECIGSNNSDGILFRAGTWRPGGEYIKKLIIRNVSNKIKKIKYKLPQSRYFSMEYPEIISLPPGLEKEIDIVFRPVEYEPYNEVIQIYLINESEVNKKLKRNFFSVPLYATIDMLSLTCTSGLDFGYIATHQVSELVFDLINNGEVDAPFRWESPAPFEITPKTGIVPVGAIQEISIKIFPTSASVFVSQAQCFVGPGSGIPIVSEDIYKKNAVIPNPILNLRISAIGKYPFLALSDSYLNFNEVVSGLKSDVKEIILYNKNIVFTDFELISYDNDRDETFLIEPKKGVIPPNGEVTIKVQFVAQSFGTFTLNRYSFRTPSGHDTLLTLQGVSLPPEVVFSRELISSSATAASKAALLTTSDTPPPIPLLTSTLTLPDAPESFNYNPDAEIVKSNVKTIISSHSVIFSEDDYGAPSYSFNFRELEIHSTSTRLFFLNNSSSRNVAFSILTDPHGVFEISPKYGVLPPFCQSFPIYIKFTPLYPYHYYRRIYILIEDTLPLIIDCYGNGFIRNKGEVKEQRPLPLRYSHIQAYYNRLLLGISFLSPDELDFLFSYMKKQRKNFMTGELLEDNPFQSSMNRSIDSYSFNNSTAFENSLSLKSKVNLQTLTSNPRIAYILNHIINEYDEIPADLFSLRGRAGTRPLNIANLNKAITRSGESHRQAVAIPLQLFNDTDSSNSAQTRDVYCDVSDINFGYATCNSESRPRIVTIYNNTNSKVLVQWHIPIVCGLEHFGEDTGKNGHKNSKEVIRVDAEEKRLEAKQGFRIELVKGNEFLEEKSEFSLPKNVFEIGPNSSSKFSIIFTPRQTDRNYLSELEAYVFFKNQRNFRLTNDSTLTPPWCFPITCRGHTFSHGQLLSKAVFSSGGIINGKKLIFPPCFKDESVFQTVVVKNTSNLPAVYDIRFISDLDNDDEDDHYTSQLSRENSSKHSHIISPSGAFTIKPSTGEIDADGFILIIIKFTPSLCKKYTEYICIRVNGEDSSKLCLEGAGSVPFITIPELISSESEVALSQPIPNPNIVPPRGLQGELFLKPTCVGLRSVMKVPIKNATRIPCRYRAYLTLKNGQGNPMGYTKGTFTKSSSQIFLDEQELDELTNIVVIENNSGILKGNELVDLSLVFTPKLIKKYDYQLHIEVYPVGGKRSLEKTLDFQQPGKTLMPECLQHINVLLHAEGLLGEVLFNPSTLDIPVRLVHTKETMKIELENRSEADICYELFYIEEFEADGVGSTEGEIVKSPLFALQPFPLDPATAASGVIKKAKISDSVTPVPKNPSENTTRYLTESQIDYLPNKAKSTLNQTTIEEIDENSKSILNLTKKNMKKIKFHHSLFCDEPLGIIPARSVRQLELTYRPVKSGLFNFTICARVIASDVYDASKTTRFGANSAWYDNEDVTLMRMVGGSEQALMVINNPSLLPHEKNKELIELPLKLGINARAAFPKLLFEDIRIDEHESYNQFSGVEGLWERFSLPSLNYDLSIPLTAEEVEAYTGTSDSITSKKKKKDFEAMKTYPWQFTPQVLYKNFNESPGFIEYPGEKKLEEVSILIRNHGFLPVEMDFHFPNEPQLELENWCDEQEPSEDNNRIIAIIEELHLFTLYPRHIKLQPGEKVILRVSYNYSSLRYKGIHNLPVLAKVHQGKQFYIDLRGQTLVPLPSQPNDAASSVVPRSRESTTQNSRIISSASVVSTSGTVSVANASAIQISPSLAASCESILLQWGRITHTNIIKLKPVPMGLSLSNLHGNSNELISSNYEKIHTLNDNAPLQKIEFNNVCGYTIKYDAFLISNFSPHISEDDLKLVKQEIEKLSLLQPIGPSSPLGKVLSNITLNSTTSSLLHIEQTSGILEPLTSAYIDCFVHSDTCGENFVPIVIRYSAVPNSTTNDFGFATNTIKAIKGINGVSSSITTQNPRNNIYGPDGVRYLAGLVQINCYDPRQPRIIPHEEKYSGGIPPSKPLLMTSVNEFAVSTLENSTNSTKSSNPFQINSLTYIQNHKLQLIEDKINFGVVPQHSLNRKVLVFVNSSPTSTFEYNIYNDNSLSSSLPPHISASNSLISPISGSVSGSQGSPNTRKSGLSTAVSGGAQPMPTPVSPSSYTSISSLIQSGLIVITPSYGRVAPMSKAFVEIKFHALVPAYIFEENIPIVVREILPKISYSQQFQQSQSSNQSPDKSVSVSKKKKNIKPHESVVTHTTFSRSANVLAGDIIMNKLIEAKSQGCQLDLNKEEQKEFERIQKTQQVLKSKQNPDDDDGIDDSSLIPKVYPDFTFTSRKSTEVPIQRKGHLPYGTTIDNDSENDPLAKSLKSKGFDVYIDKKGGVSKEALLMTSQNLNKSQQVDFPTDTLSPLPTRGASSPIRGSTSPGRDSSPSRRSTIMDSPSRRSTTTETTVGRVGVRYGCIYTLLLRVSGEVWSEITISQLLQRNGTFPLPQGEHKVQYLGDPSDFCSLFYYPSQKHLILERQRTSLPLFMRNKKSSSNFDENGSLISGRSRFTEGESLGYSSNASLSSLGSNISTHFSQDLNFKGQEHHVTHDFNVFIPHIKDRIMDNQYVSTCASHKNRGRVGNFKNFSNRDEELRFVSKGIFEKVLSNLLSVSSGSSSMPETDSIHNFSTFSKANIDKHLKSNQPLVSNVTKLQPTYSGLAKKLKTVLLQDQSGHINLSKPDPLCAALISNDEFELNKSKFSLPSTSNLGVFFNEVVQNKKDLLEFLLEELYYAKVEIFTYDNVTNNYKHNRNDDLIFINSLNFTHYTPWKGIKDSNVVSNFVKPYITLIKSLHKFLVSNGAMQQQPLKSYIRLMSQIIKKANTQSSEKLETASVHSKDSNSENTPYINLQEWLNQLNSDAFNSLACLLQMIRDQRVFLHDDNISNFDNQALESNTVPNLYNLENQFDEDNEEIQPQNSFFEVSPTDDIPIEKKFEEDDNLDQADPVGDYDLDNYYQNLEDIEDVDQIDDPENLNLSLVKNKDIDEQDINYTLVKNDFRDLAIETLNSVFINIIKDEMTS